MRLLLDTHAFLWVVAAPDRLSPEAHGAVSDPDNDVLLSVVSPWEIAIKRARGRLRFGSVTEELLEDHAIRLHGIDLRHTRELGRLPDHHQDPFDRMLVAQARMDDLTLVTRDASITGYEVATLW